MKSLHLDRINIDHALVRSLPVDIARQYQALPISTDGSQVTVSMAHPEGPDAYRAVISAIGMPSCMFQVNPGQIEHLLAEIWSQNPARIGRG